MSSPEDNEDERIPLCFYGLSRPRILYSSIYGWIAVTGGRFCAPFFRHIGLSDGQIGTALALQQLVMTNLSPWGEIVAEARELERPGRGRVEVLATGVVYGTLCYLMFALPFEWSISYIAIAGMYTLGLTMVFPVLEAISTDFLNRSSSEENLGWERFYGAVWWALTNLYMSLALDVFGFQCTYQMAACSAFAVLVSLFIYAINTQAMEKKTEEKSTIIKKCLGLDPEKARRFHREEDHSDSDSDSVSDTCTETTASLTTNSDKGTETEIMNHSEHGSDVSSVTERSLGSTDDLEHDSAEMDSSSKSTDSTESNEELVQAPSEKNDTMVGLEKPSVRVKTDADGTVERKEPNNPNKEGIVFNLKLLKEMCSTCYGCSFLFYFLCLSAGQSVADNLIFLYFESVLGAKYLLMGYTVVITIMVEIPVSQLAPKLIKTHGANTLLVVAGLAYAFRVACYSWLTPQAVGYILLLEPLHGLTYAGTLTAVSDYTSNVLPKEARAQGERLVYSMRGWCMAGGVLVGGWVQQIHGPRFMYHEVARVVFVSAVSFCLAMCLDTMLDKLLAPPCTSKKGVPAYVMDEEIGKAQRRPSSSSTSSDNMFQDVNGDMFDIETIGVNTKLDDGSYSP